MRANTATIRELRTDFRSVKRKIEPHGEIEITDHGEPAYLLKPMPQEAANPRHRFDHYEGLLKGQPKAIQAEEIRRFWPKERDER